MAIPLVNYFQNGSKQIYLSILLSVLIFTHLKSTGFKEDIFSLNSKVALTSPSGQGKTAYLKAKARRLLLRRKKVLFVVFSESKCSLLKEEIEQEFKEYQNFRVILVSFSNTGIKGVLNLIKQNKNCNILMDEVPVGIDGMSTGDLNLLSREVSNNLWIACRSERSLSAKFLQEFHVPKLNNCVKNSSSKSEEMPTRRKQIDIESSNNKSKLDRGNKTIYLSVQGHNTPLAASIDQLVHILTTVSTKIIITIESEAQEIKSKLRQSIIKYKLLFDESDDDIRKFLRSEDKILATTKSYSFLRGSEVPTLVVFSRSPSHNFVRNVFPICTSQLIVVCQAEHALRIVPSGTSNHFAMIIPVYATLMPEKFRDAIVRDQDEEVHRFLIGKNSIPANIRNKASQTGLMLACESRSSKVVELLMEDGIDEVDYRGLTALHYASANGEETCRKILESEK